MSSSDSPVLQVTALSSSPQAATTPVRRHSSPSRRTSSPPRRTSDVSDTATHTTRRRHSPTLIRTFDPNDPDARERQRTMDVDMAMQLSRARRETINLSPIGSPYEATPTPENSLPPISALSPHEEHHLDIARGTSLHTGNADDERTVPSRNGSLIDLNERLHQAQDPSLLVSDLRDPVRSSTYGLPTYQANASRSVFDFTLMEEFATAEKTALGLAPTTKFSLSALRNQRTTPVSSPPDPGPSDPDPDDPPRAARHRKLSQSNPHPRAHRKGIGGKMALFEGDPGSSSLPARLGFALGSGSSSHAHPSPYETLPSGLPPSAGGILHHSSGHDRPYRFSFYSNALAATIHARSLSELPAEGQSFEELFTGISSRSGEGDQQPGPKGRPASSIFMGRSGAGVGQRVVSPEGSYFNSNHGSGNGNGNGRRAGEKGGPPMGPNGPSEDSDDGTWWLDIQSPTDEEMKMLSKVCRLVLFLHYEATKRRCDRCFRSIH
jgi:magnesium transporter